MKSTCLVLAFLWKNDAQPSLTASFSRCLPVAWRCAGDQLSATPTDLPTGLGPRESGLPAAARRTVRLAAARPSGALPRPTTRRTRSAAASSQAPPAGRGARGRPRRAGTSTRRAVALRPGLRRWLRPPRVLTPPGARVRPAGGPGGLRASGRGASARGRAGGERARRAGRRGGVGRRTGRRRLRVRGARVLRHLRWRRRDSHGGGGGGGGGGACGTAAARRAAAPAGTPAGRALARAARGAGAGGVGQPRAVRRAVRRAAGGAGATPARPGQGEG